MTRKEALASRSPRYNSDVPCPRGHVGERHTANFMCCECASELCRKYRREIDPDKKQDNLSIRRDKKRVIVANQRLSRAPQIAAERERVKQLMADMGMALPLTRGDARKEGSAFYFTGKPCKSGHVAKRLVDGGCNDCSLINGRKGMKKQWLKNAEKLKARAKDEYVKHAEKYKARTKAYAAANPEAIKRRAREYQLKHPEVYRTGGAKRRARKIQATPPWFDAAMHAEVKAIYAEAEKLRCSDGFKIQVDHVVPLKGKAVCGLHVPWNLRLTTKRENAKKNCSFNEPFLGRYAPIPLGCGAQLSNYQL